MLINNSNERRSQKYIEISWMNLGCAFVEDEHLTRDRIEDEGENPSVRPSLVRVLFLWYALSVQQNPLALFRA